MAGPRVPSTGTLVVVMMCLCASRAHVKLLVICDEALYAFCEAVMDAKLPNTTPGIQTITSGIPNTTSGVQNITRRDLSTTAQIPNTTSWVLNTTSTVLDTTSGVPNTTSGVPNTTSAVPNTTSGLPDTTSGLPDTTSGIANTTSGVANTTSVILYNISADVLRGGPLFTDNLRALSERAATQADYIIAFGDGPTVNAASCVAKGLSIPALIYGASASRGAIYTDNSVLFNPTYRGLAVAVTSLIGTRMMKNAYVICQDTLLSDGFIDVFRSSFDDVGSNANQEGVLSESDSDDVIEVKLLNMHDAGFRLIVLHCTAPFLTRVLRIADGLNYLDMGYAWIVTERALGAGSYELPGRANGATDPGERRLGLLAVEGYEENKYDSILTSMVDVIAESSRAFSEDTKTHVAAGDVVDDLQGVLQDNTSLLDELVSAMRRSPRMFSNDGSRKDMQFRLLNYVRDGSASKWKTVGYITDNGVDLGTVVWPGQTIFGPVGWARDHLTIVMRPAEPFIYIRGPVASTIECSGDTACLRMNTSSHLAVKAAAEEFRLKKNRGNASYDIFCCEGIVVDILHSLAKDLNFDFLLYYQEDFNFGGYVDGEWTGMVGDVYSSAADFMVGALSVTSDRMKILSFTEPFYYSAFNLISTNNEMSTSWFAFLLPFESLVWGVIIAAALVTAVVTSLLEWNSPFGLSPWGRRRRRNYTLGSGLTMVFSIWFIHSVKTKSPKCWPSRVVQNVWAAAAIVILASYTAFLAAYLAGKANRDAVRSIFDTQFSTKRVGVMKGTAVEEFTTTMDSEWHTQLNLHHVTSIRDAISKLRAREIDAYMDDTPILEYALSMYDENCSIQYAAHDFGDNAYAFGFVKNSWLKEKIDPLLRNYVERGYVDDLKFRYMGKNRKCGVQGLSSLNELNKFGVEHTVGLFIMLVIGVGISCLLLVGEHVMYFVVLPRLKRCPPHSIWRKRNLEFFSQRLYRAINSEKVKHAATELVEKILGQQYRMIQRIRRRKDAAEDPTSYAGLDGMARLFTFQHIEGDEGASPQGPSPQGPLPQDNTISPYEGAGDAAGSDIVDMGSNNISHDPLLSTKNIYKRGFPKQRQEGINNPVFLSDDEGSPTVETGRVGDGVSIISDGFVFNEDAVDKYTNSVHVHRNTPSGDGKTTESNSDNGSNNNSATYDCTYNTNDRINIYRRCKKYETWPSPTSRERSLKRTRNRPRAYSPLDSSNECNKSEATVDGAMCRLCCDPSMESDDDSTQSDEVELKDNRVKSDIRQHAMASLSHKCLKLDDCAVETLSNEDLLVLWKRSEIKLQTKLNRMLHQNHHLRQMISDIEHSVDTALTTENSPSALGATKL